MKLFIYILLSTISLVQLSAQKEAYNWYFGNTAGISFAPGGSTANSLNDGNLVSPEGCASISDSTGKLLFYTNGETVWNMNHQVMSNGSGINGSSSSTQSAIIIPDPRKNKLYYIFTINSGTRTLSFSTANMNLQGGLGEIESKNVSLVSPVAEKLTATIAVNGFDYYVVAHGYGNDEFYSFPVNSTGVSTTAITSSIGISHIAGLSNAKGQMKISPDSKTLAISIPNEKKIEIFRFDDGTGRLFNQLPIDLLTDNPYGLEFSPDCKKLFVSTGSKLLQYDISIRTIDDITNSRLEIVRSNDMIHQLQLAPDGKIYFASNNSASLGRINNPNESGNLTNTQFTAVSLSRGNSNRGLPAFVQSYFTYIFTPSIITSCEGEDIQLNCNISRNPKSAFFQWTGPLNFSSTEQNPIIPKAKQTAKGYYKVVVSIGSLIFIDSVYVNIKSAPQTRIVPDGPTSICFGDTLKLFALPDSADFSYYWSTGANASKIKVFSAGTYYLTTESSGCKSYDSITISVVPSFTPEIRTSGPKIICEGDSILLTAYPETNVNSYIWSTGDTTQSIMATKGGTYSVTIDKGGCLKSSNIFIITLEKPKTEIKPLGPTSFCTGDSTELTAEPYEPDNSLLWSTGETSRTIIVRQTGVVTLETLSRNGCVNIDSIEITSGDELNVSILADNIVFCEGDTVRLDASPFAHDYVYEWSDGSTEPSIFVTESGQYFVRIAAPGGCTGSDTISIIFSPMPSAEIRQGATATICEGDSLEIFPVIYEPANSYKWSTGSIDAGATIRKPGTYTLIVTAPGGCSDTSEFELLVNPAPNIDITVVHAPTLCRGDSALLIALTDRDNEILWSTGDVSDSIFIYETGLYYVVIENSWGCKSSDTVLITFNPHPQPEILSDNGFTICDGASVELSCSSKYYKYLWSTGDTTETIIVDMPGSYHLTVFDSLGCESSATSLVRQGRNELSNLSELVFGPIKIYKTDSKTIELENTSDDTLIISSIELLGKTGVFDFVNSPGGQIVLLKNSSFIGNIEFTPNDLEFFTDSLHITIESPCPEDIFIKIEGYGSGEAEFGIPDTFGIIGERNFRIPLRANISAFNSDYLKLTYSADIKFKADIFLPELVTNGVIHKDTIVGDERILSIIDSNVIVSEGISIITEITGTILLGENKYSPITIENFEYDSPLVKFELKDGSLEAIGVCIPNSSIILKESSINMSVSPSVIGDFVTLRMDNFPEGDYNLYIHNYLGIELQSLEIVLKNKTEKLEIYLRDYISGTYIISMKSENFQINRLFLIVK